MTAMHPYVYCFGNGRYDGDRTMKSLLGGKGANLAEMSRIGLPVPPGFTVSTVACQHVLDHEGTWPEGLYDEVVDGIRHLEASMGMTFGDEKQPLLVSVRSGAALSMPGMMDTVLNLGLNSRSVEGLARATGNERFAYDAYRRFIDMFGDVVMDVKHAHFEAVLDGLKAERGVTHDVDLTAADLRDLVDRYKAIYRKHTGFMFPDDPYEQLRFAVDAVFSSWNSPRAVKYRRINRITGLLGTAVNVQAMVYGNMGKDSGTGVCFTRNPATGAAHLYGEFLVDAQGEDVVAGIRTPLPISEMEAHFPKAYHELVEATHTLERHYRNMQDIEFTVQQQRLFILQTRNGKRTGTAALKIAVDLVREGLVDEETAIRDLVEPAHLDQLLHPRFEDTTAYADDVIGVGLPASPGAAVGQVVFTAEEAEARNAAGDAVVLVRVETSPEDVGGMDAAQGILTSRGGMTSHAAVVARGWGKPCVAGCSDIVVNYDTRSFTNGRVTVREGDWVSLNGSTGEVISGRQPLVDPALSGDFATFMAWTDAVLPLQVRANADTPQDARQALTFGATGIGLCRTEHMFFEGSRINAMRAMILSETETERRAALDTLLPFQRDDFADIFRVMDGHPVTIRLLDPPLHEFLPRDAEEQAHLAEALDLPLDLVQDKIAFLSEFNPMLGHRGCRLGVTHPEITEMQTRAIVEAALDVADEGLRVRPEIMVPLVGTLAEFAHQKQIIQETADALFAERGRRVDLLIGTMIEIPRAALRADAIAAEADFFSFGTNDLTQMTFGYSRDDAGKFLPYYTEHGLLPDDPFQVIDQEGVGQLVRLGVERGRSTNAELEVGICGEHGGDPDSVVFFVSLGMDYVSCSPYRVPIARLAAAQAHLRGPHVADVEAALA